MEEKELINNAQSGDLSAFEGLVSKYQVTVYNFAYRLTNNLNDANDLAQEVLIKVFKALPKFRGKCSFSTWLYRIVYNTFLDERKKTYQKQKAKEVSIEEQLNLQKSNEPNSSPVEEIERQNLSQAVQFAINQLPPKFQLALTLYHIQGMSYQEISEITGASAGTVMSRLNRARKKLKKIILKTGIFKQE